MTVDADVYEAWLTKKAADGKKEFDAEPICAAPAAAYRYRAPFDMGRGEELPPDEQDFVDYRDYKFVGRLPIADYEDRVEARRAARAKFGGGVNVFGTARYWVVYRAL